MQDSEIRDFLFTTAQRLLDQSGVPVANLFSLQDCLEMAAKNGQDHIVVAIMLMVRGSNLKYRPLMDMASQLREEAGFSPAFAAVCQGIDRL